MSEKSPEKTEKLDQRVKYWLDGESVQNFGDSLSRILEKNLFTSLDCKWTEIRLIGSTIHPWFLEHLEGVEVCAYWGAGIRLSDSSTSSLSVDPRCALLSVRGPLSAATLGLEDAVLGDSALLLPSFFRPRLLLGQRNFLVPHFHDGRVREEFDLEETFEVLRPVVSRNNFSLLSFMKKVLAARFVMTSSLHVAILRFAYALPFAIYGDDVSLLDLPEKWCDFFGSVGIDVSTVRSSGDGKEWYFDQVVHHSRSLVNPLHMLDVAPGAVRPKIMSYVANNLLPFEQLGFIASSRDLNN